MLDIPHELLISVLFVLITIVISTLISIKAFRVYRQTNATQTFVIGLASLFIVFAMIFLTMEKAFLELFFDPNLGLLFGTIAVIISGFAVLTFDIFAYEMAFPKKTKILAILSAIPIAIYLFFWITEEKLVGLEITFPTGITPTLQYFTLVPLFSIPIIVLFYVAMKIRKEDHTKSLRAAILALGGFALATAYTVEIMGLDVLITTIFRALFPVAAIFFYWALFVLKAKE
ncbi:MAG: hypothetical protein EU536_03190 [Promethearchaeota archaeon]|nr:MAG: hypothetical protein EU536_03190 [Candidatus Lokiarchaeota archaeon]